LEQPVQILAGRSYRLQFYYRTENMEGKLWTELGPPGDPAPPVKQSLADNLDWQFMTVEFTAPSAATLILRIRGSNLSGTVWFDHFSLRAF
jgi:hypothetical protein